MSFETLTRGAALAALLALSLALPSALAQEDAPAPAAAPTFVAPVGSNLQGNEGVHVQTMCTNCNSANIDLAGLGNELLPIDLDGYPVIGGMMTIYTLNVIPASLTNNIAITKGPGDFAAPAEAVGGAIHIQGTPLAARRNLEVGLEAGGYDWQSAQANGALRLGGLTFAGRVVRSNSDSVDATGDGWNVSGELDRRYGDGELAYRFGNGATVSGGFWRIREDAPDGHGKYSAVAGTYLREDALVDLTGQRLGLDLPVGRAGSLTLRAVNFERSHEVWDQSIRTTDELKKSYDITDKNFAGEVRYEQSLSESWLLSAGAGYRRQLDTAYYGTVRGNLPPDQWIDQLNWKDVMRVETRSADAGVQATLSDRWALRLGARYDDWGGAGSAFSPRARLTYHPARAWTFTLAAGKGSRAARPIYEEICCGQALQPNYMLALEKSFGTSLEAVWQPRPEFRVGGYVHRTTFDDYILRMVGSSMVGVQTYVQGNVPEARFTGWTLTSRWIVPSVVTVDLSYSGLDAANTSGKPVPLQFYPPSISQLRNLDVPLDEIPYRAHRTASAALTFRNAAESFEFGVQGQYQGHMKIQHWDPTRYVNIRQHPEGQLLFDLEQTPAFVVVNARIMWRPGPTVRLHVGVDNIGDYVQSDLSDPTNDYNWGPIRGRYAYVGLTTDF